jgi:hypothetical protein
VKTTERPALSARRHLQAPPRVRIRTTMAQYCPNRAGLPSPFTRPLHRSGPRSSTWRPSSGRVVTMPRIGPNWAGVFAPNELCPCKFTSEKHHDDAMIRESHWGSQDMPARKRMEDQIFEPDLIEAIRLAFQRACEALQLQDTSDAFTEIVATRIIELAKAGEVDPDRLCSDVLAQLGTPPQSTEGVTSRAPPASRSVPLRTQRGSGQPAHV